MLRQQAADNAVENHFHALEVLRTLSEEDIQRISEHVEAVALAGDEKRRLEGKLRPLCDRRIPTRL